MIGYSLPSFATDLKGPLPSFQIVKLVSTYASRFATSRSIDLGTFHDIPRIEEHRLQIAIRHLGFGQNHRSIPADQIGLRKCISGASPSVSRVTRFILSPSACPHLHLARISIAGHARSYPSRMIEPTVDSIRTSGYELHHCLPLVL